MRVTVTAHPKASRAKIVKKSETEYEIWVREAPDKGRANQAILESLADFLGIAKSKVRLVRGETSRNKIIDI